MERSAVQLRGKRSLKATCEYTTTFLATHSSFSHPVNPSDTQRTQTSAAACPATATALMRVQVLCWRLQLRIRQNRNLDPSLPSFIKCPSFYLILGGALGTFWWEILSKSLRHLFLTRNCFPSQAVFPQHICHLDIAFLVEAHKPHQTSEQNQDSKCSRWLEIERKG